MINNLSTPSSELQINFGVLQIDTENGSETNEYQGERKCLKEKIKDQKFFKSKFINDFLFESDNLSKFAS